MHPKYNTSVFDGRFSIDKWSCASYYARRIQVTPPRSSIINHVTVMQLGWHSTIISLIGCRRQECYSNRYYVCTYVYNHRIYSDTPLYYLCIYDVERSATYNIMHLASLFAAQLLFILFIANNSNTWRVRFFEHRLHQCFVTDIFPLSCITECRHVQAVEEMYLII